MCGHPLTFKTLKFSASFSSDGGAAAYPGRTGSTLGNSSVEANTADSAAFLTCRKDSPPSDMIKLLWPAVCVREIDVSLNARALPPSPEAEKLLTSVVVETKMIATASPGVHKNEQDVQNIKNERHCD